MSPFESATSVTISVSSNRTGVGDINILSVTGSLESSTVTENGGAITPQEVNVRKYGEVVTSTVANVASAIDYPLSMYCKSNNQR